MTARLWSTCVLLLAAATGLTALAWSVLLGAHPNSVATAAGLHVAATALAAEGMYARGQIIGLSTARALFGVGWFFGLILPGIGPLVAVALVTARNRKGHAGRSLEELRGEASRAVREDRRRAQQVDASLDAVVDALKDRRKEVRIAAIEAASAEDSPEAVRLLSDARENTVFDVRMRAVESLARISKEHGERIAAARAAVEADPESRDSRCALADHCLRYAELGLESDEIVRGLLEEARGHAHQVWEIDNANRRAGLLLAKVYGALGEPAAAEEVYRRLVNMDDTDPVPLLGVAACQFERRDLDALPVTCRFIIRQAARGLDPPTLDVLRFWTGVT
jgi:tetratricopeptide (TPR) repeat protein